MRSLWNVRSEIKKVIGFAYPERKRFRHVTSDFGIVVTSATKSKK